MKRIIAYCALSFTAGTAGAALLSYVINVDWLGNWSLTGPRMAVNTALSFLGLVVAITCWPRNSKNKGSQ